MGTSKYSVQGELREIFLKYDGNNRRRFDREEFLEVTLYIFQSFQNSKKVATQYCLLQFLL